MDSGDVLPADHPPSETINPDDNGDLLHILDTLVNIRLDLFVELHRIQDSSGTLCPEILTHPGYYGLFLPVLSPTDFAHATGSFWRLPLPCNIVDYAGPLNRHFDDIERERPKHYNAVANASSSATRTYDISHPYGRAFLCNSPKFSSAVTRTPTQMGRVLEYSHRLHDVLDIPAGTLYHLHETFTTSPPNQFNAINDIEKTHVEACGKRLASPFSYGGETTMNDDLAAAQEDHRISWQGPSTAAAAKPRYHHLKHKRPDRHSAV